MKSARSLAAQLAINLSRLIAPLALVRLDLAIALAVLCTVLGWWGSGGKAPPLEGSR